MNTHLCLLASRLVLIALVLVIGRPVVAQDTPRRSGTVVIAGTMPDPELVALSVMVAAANPDVDFLLDTPRTETTVRQFLDRALPAHVTPVGAFPADHDAAKRWGVPPDVAQPVQSEPIAYGWSLFAKAERAIVAPRSPPSLLLHAACLAGAAKAPLFVLREGDQPIAGLNELLAAAHIKELTAVGSAAELCRNIAGVRMTALADETAVAAEHRATLARGGAIRTLVLANPADLRKECALAPWVATRRRAALLLTRPDGADAGEVVTAALKESATNKTDALLVVADTGDVPMNQRRNPAAGKDEKIAVEPWVPDGNELLTLSHGRIFHADRAMVPLMFARQRLLERTRGPPRVLIASNPGDGLPLLETFSRNTGRELENAGCQVTGRYGKADLSAQELRRLLPDQDVFLWEGHYRTLIDNFEMPKWTEPLRPSIIFLQSCLALNPGEAGLLFERGAVAVVGSPNRTYSGSGGALSLGFLSSMAYDGRDAGAAMRNAKNFLICYADLKEKRLGDAARLVGANRRAAWTFTVWGDPTLRLPQRRPPAEALRALKVEAASNTITLSLPPKRYPATEVGVYRAEMWPGGRLAGLFTADGEDNRRLAPLAFAEVEFPRGPPGKSPRLSSKLPSRNYVFRWDARRRVGYLLVLPREKDTEAIEFRVHWDSDR
jgi:hypothetical protein